MTNPRVSVITAFHNDSPTLELTIKSLMAQTFSDWELILVCDGAPPQFVKKIRKLTDPRIRMIGGDEQLGLAQRLNEGLFESKGEFIARVDADDAMLPNRLCQQVGFLDENSEIDMVSSRAFVINCDDEVVGITVELRASVREPLAQLENPIVHPTVLIRKKAIPGAPYDSTLRRTEDLDLWCRMARDDNSVILNSPTTFYRICGHQSRAVLARTLFEQKVLRERYIRGRISRGALAAKQRVKWFSKVVLDLCGLGDLVQRRRFHDLSPIDRDFALKQLKIIVDTPLGCAAKGDLKNDLKVVNDDP